MPCGVSGGGKADEFSAFDRISTTINLPDNLGMGASHFYAEVLRVKKVAALSQGRRSFVIFDELFRGTKRQDVYEATVGGTEHPALPGGVFFFLCDLDAYYRGGGGVDGGGWRVAAPLYLPTRMKGNQPVYTYQLEEGSGGPDGMIIINNEGILEMLRRGRVGMRAAVAKNVGGGFEADQQTLADLNLTGKNRRVPF